MDRTKKIAVTQILIILKESIERYISSIESYQTRIWPDRLTPSMANVIRYYQRTDASRLPPVRYRSTRIVHKIMSDRRCKPDRQK